MAQITANRKRELINLRAKAYMDHRLSELVAFAVNDPAKMPKLEEAYPFVKDESIGQFEQEHEEQPDWKKDQAILMQQAQRIKQFNKDRNGGE